jgi:hypothetical protein
VTGRPVTASELGGRLTFVAIAVSATASVLVGLASYALFLVPNLVSRPENSDFGQYWTAARLTLAHGAAAPYDVERFRAAFTDFSGRPDGYATAPPVTWLAMPLTAVPFRAAHAVWLTALLAAVGWAWWMGAGGGRLERGLQLLLLVAALPFLLAVQLAQVSLLVDALLVAHWRLLRDDRAVLAGVALGLAFVKPQDVSLVPLALLLAGRWRAALGCAATVAALAAAVAVTLGPAGLDAWARSVDHELRFDFATRHTLWAHLPGWLPAAPARGLVAALALAPALLAGRRRPAVALAGAVVGSLLVTPYLNAQDLVALIVVAWLVLREEGSPRLRTAALLSYPAVALALVVPGAPQLAVELAWLVGLAWLATRPRRPVAVACPARGPGPAPRATAVSRGG